MVTEELVDELFKLSEERHIMKVVFIIGSVSDSHIIKRIEEFVKYGVEVDVYGYKRDVNFTNKLSCVDPVLIGQVQANRYATRVFSGWKSVSKIIKKYPKDTLFYVWGFDIAIVHALRKTKYIYEISDIRYTQFPLCLNYIFKWIDRWMIKRSVKTLVTSEGFVEFIAGSDAVRSKYILMPNKLSPILRNFERPENEFEHTKIRIGYVGFYRYPDTILKMARIVGERFENIEFHFWGIGPAEMLEQIHSLTCQYPNIYEHGAFKNPDDLPRVYSTIDVVACNYDTNGINERIAEPNKLYESIFFNKPLIVSIGTFLSKQVMRLGCGFVIDSLKEEAIYSFLSSLDKSELRKIAKTEKNIDTIHLIEDYSKVWEIAYLKK